MLSDLSAFPTLEALRTFEPAINAPLNSIAGSELARQAGEKLAEVVAEAEASAARVRPLSLIDETLRAVR